MATLDIAIGSCVRTLSKFSTCNRCDEVCPVNAISLDSGFPKVENIKCVECGVCLSSCPTEAISLSNFSPLDLVFNIVETDTNILDCKVNLPCIASLSPEYLVSMAIFKNSNIVCNLSHCSTCEIFSNTWKSIDALTSEANLLLESFNREERIVLKNLPDRQIGIDEVEKSRRKLFDISNLANREKLDSSVFQDIRKKEIPDRRKLFLMALQRVGESHHVLDSNDLTTLSQKIVSDECTNCQICYRVCPSQALTTDYKNSYINFQPHLCLKCHLCHDVCIPDAIEIAPTFSISKLLNSESEKLIEFNVSKCYECDSYFTKFGNSNLCPRCQAEEDGAMELWGI